MRSSKLEENWLQLQHCSFGEIPEILWQKNLSQYQMSTCMYCSLIVFDLFLWWPLLLRMTSVKGPAHRLPTSLSAFAHQFRLPTSRNNPPQHMTMFPDIIMTVCCNRRVLELLEVVYNDELKGGMAPSSPY